MTSPVLDETNTSEASVNQKIANNWVTNGWFGEGLIYQRSFVPVGSTINLTYHVTDKDGKPLVDQDVKLRINKAYSVSNTILQVDDVLTKGIDKPPLDQGFVIHKTDAYGNVTFAVKNLDRAPSGEPQPDSWVSAPKIRADGLDDLHSQMMPEVAGEKLDQSVMSEFHYYTPTNPVKPNITHPTIRLVSPYLSDTNSIRRSDTEKIFVENGWRPKGTTVRQIYVPVSSTINLVYKVTDEFGAALPNQKVKLHVNGAYSLSNALLTDGKISTDPKKDTQSGFDQALFENLTDAYGFVVFSLINTDKSGELVAATSPGEVNTDPAKGALFSWIFPEISGLTSDVVDISEFHFFGKSELQISNTKLGTENSSANISQSNTMVIASKYCVIDEICSLGSIGPGGGTVFYDAGLQLPWGRYLEFAPRGWSGSGMDPSAPWCDLYDSDLSVLFNASLGSEIGEGKSNTKLINSVCRNSAASVVSKYRGGGMTDWFLPSEKELMLLTNFTATFSEDDQFIDSPYYYWSSSESGNEDAVSILLLDGQIYIDAKILDYCAYPVRAFS